MPCAACLSGDGSVKGTQSHYRSIAAIQRNRTEVCSPRLQIRRRGTLAGSFRDLEPYAVRSILAVRVEDDGKASMNVDFVSADGMRISTTGKAGELIADVAHRSGFDITLGCCTGNCGICEVEVRKFEEFESENGNDGLGDAPAAMVVRSCVTPLPPGYSRIEVTELVDDIWGLDGFDT